MNNRYNHNHGPLISSYLDIIKLCIEKSLLEHPRTLALRFDLRLPGSNTSDHIAEDAPTYFINIDHGVMTRFTESLKAKIKHDINKRRSSGYRVHPTSVRYVWVREHGEGNKHHYHLLLLVNNDTYTFGHTSINQNKLVRMIREAWCSALNIDKDSFNYLVHIPENPFYPLNKNKVNFQVVHESLIYRTSYMCKSKSKPSDSNRNIGRSSN
ncbi:hypothetical protein HNR62_002258 [Oceanisphaera litoralis]|uniref:inovirus Gp2 family protein n=1 Tax=Oceanisphaera litoralis TaxID=225144 RepID=UPI00195A73FB|nr:inovirus Gp2 family protein [Oceanisphaera litoralis]MBM7456372.1 hypothetical protein [Oceanisphaera litoralis]